MVAQRGVSHRWACCVDLFPRDDVRCSSRGTQGSHGWRQEELVPSDYSRMMACVFAGRPKDRECKCSWQLCCVRRGTWCYDLTGSPGRAICFCSAAECSQMLLRHRVRLKHLGRHALRPSERVPSFYMAYRAAFFYMISDQATSFLGKRSKCARSLGVGSNF